MPKKLTSLSGALSGWFLYYISFILVNFLDQFGATLTLGDYIVGISD
ncbi:hypothetical protein [Halobacillus sp. B29]